MEEYIIKKPLSSRKKRLLFVMSRFLDGGIDTVLIEYLRHIVKQQEFAITLAIGVHMDKLEVFISSIPKEVRIVYFNKSKYLTKYPIKRVKGKISKAMKIADELLQNPLRRRAIGIGLCKLAASHDVVIDFACSYPSFLSSIKKPKIGFYHFSLPSDISSNQKLRNRIYKRMAKYDRIVTISKAMESQFIDNFPMLADKVRMIYNAKDIATLQAKAKANAPSFNIKEKGKYMIAIERLEESQKDITTLLHAMSILKKKYHQTTPLYILGKGKSEEQLKFLAHELEVDDIVKFMGFTANPYPWLKNCTILLHSAKFEGLPTVLIEGLLLDKFIISSDCPTGPREILNNGKAGILVPIGDANGFAEAVMKLSTDEHEKARIIEGMKAQKHFFTFDDTYKKFQNIINELT